MFNLWKKSDPDGIWMGPALILMSILLFIPGKDYINRDVEWIMLCIMIVLIIIGTAMRFLSPIQKGFDRGIISENFVLKCKEASLYTALSVVGINIVNMIALISR